MEIIGLIIVVILGGVVCVLGSKIKDDEFHVS